MQRILLVSLMLVSVSGLTGCGKSQTLKDSWKFTTRQYRTYLNTPVSLDMQDKGGCELYELALGEALLSVDGELHKLIRAMENSDRNPDPAWVMSMMNRFPWLSGVALVDGSGKLNARYPEQYAKEFDASPLMEADPKQQAGALRAYVQQHPAGPEIYLANPVFDGAEMRGLIVVFFDPKALVTTSSDPGSFVLAAPFGVIWPGNFGDGSTVAGQKWDEVLKEKSCGLIGSKDAEFFWTTRYLGNLPLVYAVPVSAGKSQEAALNPPEPGKAPVPPVSPVPADKGDKTAS